MFALSLFALAVGGAGHLDGHWEGAASREGAVQRIEFHFHADGDKLSGTFDIPELGLYREALANLALDGDKLALHFLYGDFELLLHEDVDEITSLNSKWGPPLCLHLKRGEDRPFCRYEEVRWKSGKLELAGTLVLPLGVAKAPAIIVLGGSTPQGRFDGASAWTYRSWGEIAASHGVAALVFDKRGVGASTGDIQVATFDDQAGDAIAAIDLLAKHAAIDAQHIGVLGISQGGWVAPIVATRDPRIAFVVLDVGPAVSVRDQELDRVENLLKQSGASESDVREALEFTRAMFDTAYGKKPWSEFAPLAEAAAKKKWAEVAQVPTKLEDLEWWRIHEYDPSATLSKLKTPLLALFGDSDPLVPPKKNLARMQDFLRVAQNSDATFKTFPGVGHGCEVERRLIGDDWKWPTSFWVWSKRVSGFYATIFDWIAKHASR